MDINPSIRRSLVLARLVDRRLESDLTLCMFLAAVTSQRANDCVRPFPPAFMPEMCGKEFRRLHEVCNSIPSIKAMLDNPDLCTDQISELLYWLLLIKPFPVPRLTTFAKLPEEISEQLRPMPTHMFEIIYSEDQTAIWDASKRDRHTLFAYHGCPMENYYSILHYGLQQSNSNPRPEPTQSVFHEGVQLTVEPNRSAVAVPFSSPWAHTKLGESHRVIAVCEVIHDANKVFFEDRIERVEGAEPDNAPPLLHKYVVVNDPDLMRVKYLFVYAPKKEVASYFTLRIIGYMIIVYIALIIVATTYFKLI